MNPAPPSRSLTWLGLLLVALVSLPPLLLEPRPVGFLPPYASALAAWGSKALVVLLLGAVVVVRARADAGRERPAWLLNLAFVGLAGLLTACHWVEVDRGEYNVRWQRDKYLKIFNHEGDELSPLGAPHNFRPLPYGFARSLERLTGDWWFACVAYRWFFTYWLVWAWHRFARVFLPPRAALLALGPLPLLYPLSVLHYSGQLTDPLSHSLFVLGMVYIVEDRPGPLAAALALGVLAKETAVILVPAYLACWWRRGTPALAWAALLTVVCVAAALAVRLPLGWRLGYGAINGTEGLMVGPNLGIGESPYRGAAPTWENYAHPLLFVGVFLPPIAWGWRRLDGRLRALCLTPVPLLLLSNLCFGWMYESRNYVPLVPLLATSVLAAAGRREGGPRPA